MKEDFLHMVWLHRWMNESILKTVDGQDVEVIKVGSHNFSSGPDFLESQVKIGGTKWIGSVEIHWRSSDWYAHGHQGDSAYRNVILHVVYEHDREVIADGVESIPTLELKGRIQKRLYQRYEQFFQGTRRLPCANFIQHVKPMTISSWLDRMLAERWQDKLEFIKTLYDGNTYDWQQGFYQLVARYIGMQYNRAPMAELAGIVPLKLLQRYDEAIDRDALLLGTAGFLDQDTVEGMQIAYVLKVQERYRFLKQKHGLDKVRQHWKTGRVRPLNHPTRRLAQFAAVTFYLQEAYEMTLQAGLPNWSSMSLQLNDYWTHHYNFYTSSKRPLNRDISKAMSDLLNINVTGPFLFFYAEETGNEVLKQKAIDLLHEINSEENKVVRFFRDHGVVSESAAQSQGMIQLKTAYCDHKKCVLCNIGRTIISKA